MICSLGDEAGSKIESRYSLVIAVAKRAKQLREGAPRLVETRSKNPITIALEEIKQGKLKIMAPTAEELEAAERHEVVARPGIRETANLLRTAVQEEETPAVIPGVEAAEPEQPGIDAAQSGEQETAQAASGEEQEETPSLDADADPEDSATEDKA